MTVKVVRLSLTSGPHGRAVIVVARPGVWTDQRWVPGYACRKFRVGEFNEVAVR